MNGNVVEVEEGGWNINFITEYTHAATAMQQRGAFLPPKVANYHPSSHFNFPPTLACT